MFHAPERSRNTTHPVLGSSPADGNNGAFDIESPDPGWRLMLIASDGMGWEHVSVHAYRSDAKQRTPNWREMCYVKDLCWDGEDVVIQFHPRKSEYVNQHPHTLHLWKPTEREIPTPQPIQVGTSDRMDPNDAEDIYRRINRDAYWGPDAR